MTTPGVAPSSPSPVASLAPATTSRPVTRPSACRRTATAVWPASTVTSPGSAASSARSTSAPVASPPAWMTRVVPWPPSRVRARRAPGALGVERRPAGPQVGHRVGSAGQDLPGGRIVHQPAARREGVGHVRVDAVARDVAEHDRDPALRPPRRTLVGGVLGDDEDPQPRPRRLRRGREPGDPGADDDEIGRRGPRRPHSPPPGRPISIIRWTEARALAAVSRSTRTSSRPSRSARVSAPGVIVFM